MATYLLDSPIRNWRGHAESFPTYRARLRRMNYAIKQILKGRMAHVSAPLYSAPYMLEDDEAVNEQIRSGQIRQHKIVTLKNGTTLRIGVYKGTTYRKPKGE